MTRAVTLGIAYAAITAVVASPLIDYRHLGTASYEGDARLVAWTLAWDAHALLRGLPMFEANIYHPEPHALAFAEHHVGAAIFGIPIYAMSSNPVLTYWVLWLLAFPLNAIAMYALAWRVIGDRHGAFAAGCVYAFCFFRMHHAHGHLQLLWTWMLPLVPLALEDWVARPTVPRVIRLAALVTAAVLTSWYVAVFTALLAACCAVCLAPGRALSRAHAIQSLAAAAASLAIVGWFAAPYLALAPGPVAEAAANSADLRAYLVPPANTWPGRWLTRAWGIETRWIWGEQTLYVGAGALVLAAVGAPSVRSLTRDRVRVAAGVLLAGGTALALSFGPTPTGFGPFDLVSRLPGLALLRAPARFALLVMMAVALLCGLGAARLRAIGAVGRFAAIALLAWFFVESFVVDFPGGKPRPFPVPAVYGFLAHRPPGAVLSLPSYRGTAEAFRESDYLLYSTAHWRRIVNGFGRQEPPGHGHRMAALTTFPSPESIAVMRRIGVRYVVLHTRRASELAERADAAQALARSMGEDAAVRLVHSTDGDFLFEVR